MDQFLPYFGVIAPLLAALAGYGGSVSLRRRMRRNHDCVHERLLVPGDSYSSRR